MSPAAAWRLLDLAPTGDGRAVKRAYAAKLKAIDPDRDVAGFLRLREALEIAQRAAARMADAPADGDAGTASSSHPIHGSDQSIATIAPRQQPIAGEDAEPASAPIEEAVDVAPDIREDIAAMLGSGAPDPETLIAAMRQLFADERMQQVAFSSETEDWLAFLLVRTIPRSDPVIALAARHFNWRTEAGKANRRPMVVSAVQRVDDLACIASLRDPSHRWHGAFMKLLEPGQTALSIKDRLQLKPDVAEMLDSLRYHNPMVERLFDPAHVALWNEAIAKTPVRHPRRKPGISWYGWMAIGWLGLTIVRLVLTAMGVTHV